PRAAGQPAIQVFFSRAGSTYGNRAYFPSHDKELTLSAVLAAFIGQFYDNKEPPRLVLASDTPDEMALLQAALTSKAGRVVRLEVPRRGAKRDLIDQALVNAREALARRLSENASQRRLLEGLAAGFCLEGAPQRVAGSADTHISGPT